MPQQRQVKRRQDPDVLRRIHEMAQDGWTGAAITRQLEDEFGDRAPRSERTVQDIVRKAPRPAPPSKWWSIGEAPADEAAAVVPVLGELVRQRIADRISQDLGPMIAKLREVAPDMPAIPTFRMASRYLMAAQGSQDTKWLDVYMALELWRDPLAEKGAVQSDLIPVNWWYVGPQKEANRG